MTAPGSRKRGAFLFLLGCAVGGVVGFGAGVASVKAVRETFLAAFHDEQAAEIDVPQEMDRPSFRLQYPRNWKLTSSASGDRADATFSIESPGHSFVMFAIATGALDPATAVDAQVRAQTAKVIRDATRMPFERWGAYPGVGMLLTGNKLGLTPGTLRVFAFRVGERTFTVIESTSDDDRSQVEPGFKLIERSFQAKDAP